MGRPRRDLYDKRWKTLKAPFNPQTFPTFLVGKISCWSSDQRVFAMLVGRPAEYRMLVWGLTEARLLT